MGILGLLKATSDRTYEIAEKLNMGDGVPKDTEREGLKLDDDDPYKKLQKRLKNKDGTSDYSFSTLNTILAIKDIRRRKRIVTRRINRLKCLIKFLFCLAFVLSWPYFYIAYVLETNSNENVQTLAFRFVGNHVSGTANFEAGLSLWLFIISCFRFCFDRNEGVYYVTHISYLFAVFHYVLLIPLNARNLQKHLSNLEQNMREEMDLGRCSKVETSAIIPPTVKFNTIAKIVDDKQCVLKKKDLQIGNLRPVTFKECDGETSWYGKATSLAENITIKDEILSGKIPPVRYEVFSKSWTASQRLQGCCGIKTFEDWQETSGKQHSKRRLDFHKFIYPTSCCAPDLFKNNTVGMCTEKHVSKNMCTPIERVTVIEYSLGLLITLIVCGIFNFTIFTLFIRYRVMVVRFRPDLLDL